MTIVAAGAEGGATTHPELVAGVIDCLRENHFSNICVLEGSWVGARTDAAFRASGIGRVCEERGISPILICRRTAAFGWMPGA